MTGLAGRTKPPDYTVAVVLDEAKCLSGCFKQHATICRCRTLWQVCTEHATLTVDACTHLLFIPAYSRQLYLVWTESRTVHGFAENLHASQ